eukprot:4304631-Pyramimonas_sp.AAC.1
MSRYIDTYMYTCMLKAEIAPQVSTPARSHESHNGSHRSRVDLWALPGDGRPPEGPRRGPRGGTQTENLSLPPKEAP